MNLPRSASAVAIAGPLARSRQLHAGRAGSDPCGRSRTARERHARVARPAPVLARHCGHRHHLEVHAVARRRDASCGCPLALPRPGFRGYGVDLSVSDTRGALLARDSTALDVLDDWTQAPRYGFLSDFAPGDPAARQNVRHPGPLSRQRRAVLRLDVAALCADAAARRTSPMRLGRALSLHTVREKVAACARARHGRARLCRGLRRGAGVRAGASRRDALRCGGPAIQPGEALLHHEHPRRAIPGGAQHPGRDGAGRARGAVRRAASRSVRLPKGAAPSGQAEAPRPYDLAQDFPPFIDDARARGAPGASRHAA